MAGAQFQRAFRPQASDEDLKRTALLWTTTGLSATQIGLMFQPPVTRNVILGRIKKLKLIGASRPPRPDNVVKLPPPAERPKPTMLRKNEEPPAARRPLVDKTPRRILDHMGSCTATMRPFGERKPVSECAYVIETPAGLFSCCGRVVQGSYCKQHARWCYEVRA